MKNPNRHRRRPVERPCLVFSPEAYLKLQLFCHAADTEIGGFGITAASDPLYIEQFVTVRQSADPVNVEFDDDAVADFFDCCVDAGLMPDRFARVWLHTHPGDSVEPSGTDEDTFARVFGGCDHALMFILGRTGRTYARLSFSIGPGGSVLLPTAVDWSTWPTLATDPNRPLADLIANWNEEFATNIRSIPESFMLPEMVDLDSAEWADEMFGVDERLLHSAEEVQR